MFKRLLHRPSHSSPPTLPHTEPLPHPSIVGDDGFAAALHTFPDLTVVDFWAEWCQPCDVMSDWVERLANDFAPSLRVLALDVDENPKTPARYGVMGLPTLIFFREGIEVERTTGVATYGDLKRQVEKLLVIGDRK